MLTLIIKPVGNACPLSCRYCYTTDPNLSRRESSGKMSLKLFEQLARDFFSREQRGYRFIWHGGEPLLWGLDTFKEALAIQRSLKGELGIQGAIVNKIQTNGVLIDEAWADFFKRCKFRVGVSLDGPREIHDAMRAYRSGKGSFDNCMRGIQILEKAGVQCGINAVVTQTGALRAEEMFEFFSDRFSSFNFAPCFESTATEGGPTYRLTAEMYSSFVIDIWEEWISYKGGRLNIPVLRRYLEAATGSRPRVCSWRGTCANYLGIMGDGSVYPCGRFAGLPELKLGYIQETSIWDMSEGRLHQSQLDEMLKIPNACGTCRWNRVCNNGCPAHRYTSEGGFLANSPLCAATQKILGYVEASLKA